MCGGRRSRKMYGGGGVRDFFQSVPPLRILNGIALSANFLLHSGTISYPTKQLMAKKASKPIYLDWPGQDCLLCTQGGFITISSSG